MRANHTAPTIAARITEPITRVFVSIVTGTSILCFDPSLIAQTEHLLTSGLVTRGPKEANQKVRDRFSCSLEPDGNDCVGIRSMREVIYRIDPHLACALSVIAPHTHWNPGDFIVEQFDAQSDTYLIGPSKCLPRPLQYPLFPISFVLTSEGPIAFEWADSSTDLGSADQLGRLWSGIDALTSAVLETAADEGAWPLGVTVQHRFKNLWELPAMGTMEAPSRLDPAYAEVRRSASSTTPSDKDVVQVGWSAYMPEEFTEVERVALARLDAALADMGEERASKFLAEIERFALSTPRSLAGNMLVMGTGLGAAWSVLREPLTSLTFTQMKEAAAASGLPTTKLSDLRQTSGGGRSASKAELADAIDGLFNKLDKVGQDQTALHMVTELLRRSSNRERLEELLERVGWHLVGDEPVPLDLRLDLPPDTLPDPVREAFVKAVRRYRDGDFDGAMTSVVGVIDTITETIYDENGLPNHKQASYQQRAVTAHKTLESRFRTSLVGMSPAEADRSWSGQHRAVNGAADVLGAFRRNYSDAHGAGSGDPGLVQMALHSALFVVYSLTN